MNCFNCNGDVAKPGVGVTCDGCNRSVCIKCSGLSATETRCLELKNRRMKFLCTECESGLQQIPVLHKLIRDLQEEVNAFKKQQQMRCTEDMISELSDRQSRAKNIIMFDIPECDLPDLEQRKLRDTEECWKVIGSITSTSQNNIKVLRLGKPSAEKKFPRPIKIIFQTRGEALAILKNKNKLKKPNSIKSDQTPMQRQHLIDLRNELHQRTEKGEKELTIKYIKGSPKIIKIPKNM